MNSLATWTTRNSQGTFNKEKMLRKENLLLLKKCAEACAFCFFVSVQLLMSVTFSRTNIFFCGAFSFSRLCHLTHLVLVKLSAEFNP